MKASRVERLSDAGVVVDLVEHDLQLGSRNADPRQLGQRRDRVAAVVGVDAFDGCG